jgi:hypothetical protein
MPDTILTFTLDTNAVIAGAQKDAEGVYVDRLVEMSRAGTIALVITAGFDVDQVAHPAESGSSDLSMGWSISVRPSAVGGEHVRSR